jgi:hypothetical protein
MKDRKTTLIPLDKLDVYPFGYKYLRNIMLKEYESGQEAYKFNLKSGTINVIQNEDARINCFYKIISRI